MRPQDRDTAPADARLLAKRVLGALARTGRRPSARRIVLLFHSVGDTPFAVNERVFRMQMEWLAAAARVRPLLPLLHEPAPDRLQVALTFDDGYASVYDRAFPLLHELKLPAAMFVNSGQIGDGRRQVAREADGYHPGEAFLLWRELALLTESGWSVGSHGVRHLDLTKQAEQEVRAELTNSRAQIERKLGACSPVFSYTWGRHTTHLRGLVKETGYSHAVAGVHAPLGDDTDPLAIPRIAIAREYTLSDFRAIVEGDWDYLQWLQRSRAWLPRMTASAR